MADVSQLTPTAAEPGVAAAGQAGLSKFFARLVREQPLGTDHVGHLGLFVPWGGRMRMPHDPHAWSGAERRQLLLESRRR